MLLIEREFVEQFKSMAICKHFRHETV